MHLQFGRSPTRCGTALAAVLCIGGFLSSLSFAQSNEGALDGSVSDPSGSMVSSAIVNLQPAGASAQRTTITDQNGLFHFPAVQPGTYSLAVKALGFLDYEATVPVVSSENPFVAAVLQIAPEISKVDVTLPPHELAAEQIHAEEQQRVLGVFPNFFVSYQPNAAPLTAAQKFQLGWRTLIDPEVILSTALGAGIEQWRNSYPEFGQGAEGYGKRLGAGYADRASGVFIGHVVTQSIFHQDPRYFYKGTGTVRSRFLYAVWTAFVCKGDNGHWQPDYSDVIGGLASGEISTLYYPASSRTGLRLFHSVLLGFGNRAASHLAQEFVYRKFTTHVPKIAARMQPVLREGTPLPLISIENLRSAGPEKSRAVNFVLAKDIEVNGVVVAKTGSRATGEVLSSAGPANASGDADIHLSFENVHLQVGNRELPLTTISQKESPGGLQYHWLEETGRIELELYLARDVSLPPAQ